MQGENVIEIYVSFLMKNVTALEITAKTISKLAYILKPYTIIVSTYKYTINCKLPGTKYTGLFHRVLMSCIKLYWHLGVF